MAIWETVKNIWSRWTTTSDANDLDEAFARDAVADRRAALEEAGLPLDPIAVPPGSMGIAFSGGGIRSATISLGVTQALAKDKDKQLLDFDYCSTVSGGGYFGSFLTSLFVPDDVRGAGTTDVPTRANGAPLTLRDKLDIAFDALGAKARSINLTNPGGVDIGTIRNPVWWLREHSRYLAPMGAPAPFSRAVFDWFSERMRIATARATAAAARTQVTG